jgi:ribosome maturation factor RimP
MGARRPFFVTRSRLTTTYEKERELARDIEQRVEAALPGTEVLAVELNVSERFCVYIDHAQGVDHALCERVTNVLREYLRDYSVEVSSPGVERPLRRPEHFRRVVGHSVAVRTSPAIDGRRRFRGEVKDAGERDLTVDVGDHDVHIPYDAIVRGNLIATTESR